MTDRNVVRVDDPHSDGTAEREVVVRAAPGEPLRHAGSVSVPTASAAYDHASSLVGWTAN